MFILNVKTPPAAITGGVNLSLDNAKPKRLRDDPYLLVTR